MRASTLFFCMAGLTNTASAAIPAAEREALIAIYNATGGPNWTNRTGWLGASGTECTWQGVNCSLDTVSWLDMDNNNMVGTLPANTFQTLRNLQFIYMHNNRLAGPIPSIAGVNRLSAFWLHDNQFTGPIPALVGSPRLTSVNLSRNQLSGPIPALTGLDDLSSLLLSDNRLSGSIPSLADLIDLVTLHLDGNELTGPIPRLDELFSLDDIMLSDNRLRGPIPTLPLDVQYVRLDGNRLTGAVPPAPPRLSGFVSDLCPNRLAPTPSPAWDAATGDKPWYRDCDTDRIFVDGFEPS
jgi:hypothetical protein